uniref:Piwi domain-containing protein n=1 Tax=Steinernema glaseri TaxID=37863 RepID=A0A1I8A9G3_9BILA
MPLLTPFQSEIVVEHCHLQNQLEHIWVLFTYLFYSCLYILLAKNTTMSEQEDQELRAATKIRKDAEKKFEEMGLEVGQPVMPTKIPVPPNGNVVLTTNLFPVNTHKQVPVYRWDVEISISLRNGRQLALTKKSDSDAVSVDRKSKTKIIFEKMVDSHQELFGSRTECFYDMESTLYTMRDIRKNLENPEEDSIQLVINELDAQKFQGTTSANVQLKKVRDKFEVDLTSFRHITANVESTDMSHKQFLELVTSQVPMMSDAFVTFHGGVSFSMAADVTQLKEGKYLGHGIQKSVRYVENMENHAPQAAVAVDLKKTAFHAVMSGLDYLSQLIDVRPIYQGRKLNEQVFTPGLVKKMKGIRCRLTYGSRHREIVIHEISKKTAEELSFERDGENVSLIAYFYETYNVRIKYPKAPLAVEKKPGQRTLCYYPLECIEVLDNQRVTGELPQSVIREVIKYAAVLPSQRLIDIRKASEEIQLFDNAYLQNLETTIDPNPIRVEGRQITTPKLIFGGNATMDSKNGQWGQKGGRRHMFLMPATITSWTVLMISELTNGAAGATLNKFITMFMGECRQRGMHIEAPTDPWPLNINKNIDQQMEDFFYECKNLGIEFVLVMQDGCFHHHKFLKYLERKYKIITQDVMMTTVKKVEQHASATLENIVQKTNMKLGGLNYAISMKNPQGTKDVFTADTMFVGLAMAHSKPPKPDATGQEPPKPASVVGYAANVLAQQFAFIGDYYYQAADRDEKIDSMLPIMERLLQQWAQHHDGQMPKEILFFRNGASEGQYKSILKFEIPLIQKALEDFRERSTVAQIHETTKFCFLVATKRHNVRIFKANIEHRARATEQNLAPGIAVDRSITHPVFTEFYVNAHTTLQGTGKIPRYAIMYNDAGFKIGQLEHIVFGLAHLHQIVNLTTSLPTPSYIASDYADRGMAVLHQFLKDSGSDVNSYEQFNAMLSYAAVEEENSPFHFCRVNA